MCVGKGPRSSNGLSGLSRSNGIGVISVINVINVISGSSSKPVDAVGCHVKTVGQATHHVGDQLARER